MPTMTETLTAIKTLRPYIGPVQLATMADACRGPEREWFKGKLVELAALVSTMPKTYEQDGMGDAAMVYLHYFHPAGDWWVTERDMEPEQMQAFGLVRLGDFDPELGYISITELCRLGVELDLHWTPKTIGQVRGKK